MFIRPNQPETPTPIEDNLDEDVIIGEVRSEDNSEDQDDDDLGGGEYSSRSPIRADEESAERANESRVDEIRERGRQDRKLDCLQTSVSKLTNQVTNLLEVTTNLLKTDIRERKSIRRDINTQNIDELSIRVEKYSKEVRELRNRKDFSQSPAKSSMTRSVSSINNENPRGEQTSVQVRATIESQRGTSTARENVNLSLLASEKDSLISSKFLDSTTGDRTYNLKKGMTWS
ncbi:hypothetical protein QAD02_012656 [Eretmocerus hayati]|uniref:Uncharacterized protein n=1 Tax=Eretmocerus hayati TaxID=131215 RepID=A0ACC2P023_9HYME|nr:hypothetical protein QAD02_012656 [Eretmocerus hayati]